MSRPASASWSQKEQARKKMRDMRGRGFMWKGQARALGCSARAVRGFALENSFDMALTPARQAVIDRFYQAFFPESVH